MVVTPSFGVMPNFGGAMRDAYGAAQDRAEQQREIQYRDTRRRGAEAYGQHIAGGDYESAATVAGKLGDAEGAVSARTMGQEDDYQTARRLHGQLGSVLQVEDPRRMVDQYGHWHGGVQSLAEARGHGAGIERFRTMFPSPDDLRAMTPEAARARIMQAYRENDELMQSLEASGVTRAQGAENRAAQATAAEARARDARDYALREYTATRPRGGGGVRAPSGYEPDGSGGLRPIRGGPADPAVRGGRQSLAGAELRGRLMLSYPNIVAAQNALTQADAAAVQRQGTHGSASPLGQDWLARMAEAIPWDGGAVANALGGDDYQQYAGALRSFESNMIPIFSGSAVTESEAQRFVRANLPGMATSPEQVQRFAANRARMVNSAAIILGAEPPYPEAGFWTPSGGLVGLDGVPLSPEDYRGGGSGGGYDPREDDLAAREAALQAELDALGDQ